MKLCYQVATPDVKIAPSVTAFQGPLDNSFSALAALGYDGVELMTLDPSKLNWDEVRDCAKANHLSIVLVCTGEIFGQLGLSFADIDAARRSEAVERVKAIIDFAAHIGASLVNIGRVRGQYHFDVPHEQTEAWAVDAFRTISDYAAPKGVTIALESVTQLQTNFINSLAEAADMVERVNRSNFRLMMDIFHLNIEEKDVLKAIEHYSPLNVHAHLADNNRRYPGQCGFDFTKILTAFHDCGYDGAFCTEIFQYPDQEISAKKSIEHLRPILDSIYGRV